LTQLMTTSGYTRNNAGRAYLAGNTFKSGLQGEEVGLLAALVHEGLKLEAADRVAGCGARAFAEPTHGEDDPPAEHPADASAFETQLVTKRVFLDKYARPHRATLYVIGISLRLRRQPQQPTLRHHAMRQAIRRPRNGSSPSGLIHSGDSQIA
jgi:hypothetical protein